jgi:hypothetical protein
VSPGAAALALLALAAAARAQVRVRVLVAEPLATALVDELRAALGAGADVGGAAAGERTELPGGTVLVAADDWQLWLLAREERLAAVPDLAPDLPAGCRDARRRWALPWSMRYVLAYEPAVLPVDTQPRTFEALALDPRLHDRLGLCPPEVDPVPWLAAMEESLVRGGTEAAGFALWTTLDARAGRYAADWAAIVAGLAAGTFAAAIVPEPMLNVAADVPATLHQSDFGDGTPVARLGVAVVAPADAAALDVARRIAAEPLRSRIRTRSGLGGAAAAPGPFDGRAAESWLHHFDRAVRGRGRSAERIADTLDVVFTLLFALVVFFVWRRMRAAGRPPAAGPT